MNKRFAVSVAAVGLLAQLVLGGAVHAISTPKVWSGGGSDNNMSTAANWEGGVAPTATTEEILVFPAGVTDKTVVNDFATGTAVFGSITFNGADSDTTSYTISGNGMTVTGGISAGMTGSDIGYQTISAPITLDSAETITSATNNALYLGALAIGSNATALTGAGSITINGAITGSGAISRSGGGSLYLLGNNAGFTGGLTMNAGRLTALEPAALGAVSGAITVNAGADLTVYSCTSPLTVAKNIALTGASTVPSGSSATPKLVAYAVTGGCGFGGGGADETYGTPSTGGTATWSGNITFGSDVTLGTYSDTLNLTGALTGNYLLNLIDGWAGTLHVAGSINTTKTPNGDYTPNVIKTTLGDNQSTNTVAIYGGAEVTIDGQRSTINLLGGKLLGTGTIGVLAMSGKAILAPGHSPGVLNTGDLVFTGGTYQAELGGTAVGKYDQLNVTGTVTLGAATVLTTTLVDGFKPAKDNTFTIIKNDGSDAVTGTFQDLAEGATFTLSGNVFKISYIGGDGNDVVLTALTVPAAPAAGLGLIPGLAMILLATLIAVGSLMHLALKPKNAV